MKPNVDLAMRWALVQFHVDLEQQAAEDRAKACKENGWRMSDASGRYTEVIALLEGLVLGTIDADEYLERERHAALDRGLVVLDEPSSGGAGFAP